MKQKGHYLKISSERILLDGKRNPNTFNFEKQLPPNTQYREFNLSEDLIVGNKVCVVTRLCKVRIGIITDKRYIEGICLVDDTMANIEDIKLLILEA